MRTNAGVIATVGVILSLTTATLAEAGVDACNNLRLEDVGSCEVVVSGQCSGGCSELGVYEKACATKLHTVCKEDCTLLAEPTCTDACTVQCAEDCDNGINVICQHNCFGECSGVCASHCEGSADVSQCMASCEASCDGECDIKCQPLVDASCYQHCVECCGGSCTAQSNMDCQTTCQDEQFEECEYELKADCDASCTGEGALFCDGEFVLSGAELPGCVQALIAAGIGGLQGEVTITSDGIDADSSLGGCTASPARSGGAAACIALLAAVLGLSTRRGRRPRARP